MQIDGACHCGFITYRAEVDPATVTICHCTDCQTLSGSAFRTVVPAPASGFAILGGKPRVYVKIAESGNRRAQAFCPECGTPIYSAAETDAQFYSIRVGTARQRAELRPRSQQWRRSACDWVEEVGSMQSFPTRAA